MNTKQVLSLVLDPGLLLRAQGLQPDPWQQELLLTRDRFVLLNCSRQSGKSTTVAALALHQALVRPGSLALLVAPAERQSHELLRKVMHGFRALGRPIRAVKQNEGELELMNGSRIVALPGQEQTIRSFSGVNLLVIDEAACVPVDLYRSLRPMLAVSGGRLVALSTPHGQKGWFYHEWMGTGPWKRVEISWRQCPRIKHDELAEDARTMGQAWIDQEYGCQFTAMAGLVYPEFHLACVPDQPLPPGKPLGGIDFGWRNPFAAVWGVLDRDDVLWIGSERYLRETPISEHAAALPRNVMWYADPAGRTEIEELRRHNLVVRSGKNDIRGGIARVNARIRTGRLKVLPACVNLIAESKLYCYPRPEEQAVLGENPVDAHNHGLAALRYMVSPLQPPRPPGQPSLDYKPLPSEPGMGLWRPV